MDGDKPLALIVYEPQQIRPALWIQIYLTMTEKENGVHVAQAWTAAGRFTVGHLWALRDDT